MEKIINITIGNFTFTIEEPAFDILKKYLNDLEIHFSATEGKEEIISDIEIRIGELLNQKVSEAKKVVNAADIIQVIEQMGNPSDIGEGESQEQEKSTYENRNYSTYRRRRVFRDPDNSKIGGVCGGVAAYFDIDPVWLRLAFVISVFFFGTGVLLYIILWVVLPEANTASEKLEMRGEPIDVNNIEKTIKENLKKVKSDFKDYYQKEGKQNMRKGGALASSFLADLFHQVGFIILRIVGGFLLLLGLILLVLWIKTMAFSTSNGFSGFITGVFSESWQKELSIIAILTFVAIPLLSLCYGGFQMLFGIRYRNKPIKYTFNILSTLAIITIVYLGYVTFENFSTTGSNTSTTKITNMDSTKTINISFNEDEYFDNDQKITPTQNTIFYSSDNEIRIGNIEVKIKKSDADSSYITIENEASGLDINDARKNAAKIHYQLELVGDKVEVPNFATYDKSTEWRNQQVRVTIYLANKVKVNWSNIPENIHFEPKLANDKAEEDYYDNECKSWIMTETGLEKYKEHQNL